MKSKEELNDLKKEYEELKAKLAELSEEELEAVAGGVRPDTLPDIPDYFRQSYSFIG